MHGPQNIKYENLCTNFMKFDFDFISGCLYIPILVKIGQQQCCNILVPSL